MYNPFHFHIAYNISSRVVRGGSISIPGSHQKQYLPHFHQQM